MPQTDTQPQLDSQADSSDGTAAQAKAAEVAGQAQEKAQHLAGQAQDRLREQLDQRSSQLGAQIAEQASDLRAVSESLREQEKDGPAKAAEELARRAETLAQYLSSRDSHALLADAEDLGRRQPLATAAAGLAAGFMASRFLKASSTQRYRGRSSAAGSGAPVGSSQDGSPPPQAVALDPAGPGPVA